MENKITLSLDLVNAIMGFLGKQPYEQVFPLINAIQKEAEGQVAPAVEESADE